MAYLRLSLPLGGPPSYTQIRPPPLPHTRTHAHLVLELHGKVLLAMPGSEAYFGILVFALCRGSSVTVVHIQTLT